MLLGAVSDSVSLPRLLFSATKTKEKDIFTSRETNATYGFLAFLSHQRADVLSVEIVRSLAGAIEMLFGADDLFYDLVGRDLKHMRAMKKTKEGFCVKKKKTYRDVFGVLFRC